MTKATKRFGRVGLALTALAVLAALAGRASAFCGFYVGKADTKLFNKASKVVMVRNNDRTVLTMANDYEGDAKEFALVVPVPTVLEREQIHVTEMKYVDHLDAFSAPRLVEYFDEDPCQRRVYDEMRQKGNAAAPAAAMLGSVKKENLGVTIEATYTVGEYDILILSAKQSGGLEIWLRENGYKVPKGASRVLGAYIKQGLKFFVAKVNLKERDKAGFTYLRPIQIAYESPRFMLPIRLGMVNSDGPQDLFIFALTRNGRVETLNYRTVKLPTDVEIPPYVKDHFADFYQAMFTTAVKREDGRAVFLEYNWDMSWCDPCAADPLSREELKELGVFWLDQPQPSLPNQGIGPGGGIGPPQGATISRLHVRYDNEHFPEDLVFQETGDKTNFQGRYILRHPWKGSGNCPEAANYHKELRKRQEHEAETLANLTGWKIDGIREKAGLTGSAIDPVKPATEDKWYKNLWKTDGGKPNK